MSAITCPRCESPTTVKNGRLSKHRVLDLYACPAGNLTPEGAHEVANLYKAQNSAYEQYRDECRAYFARQESAKGNGNG